MKNFLKENWFKLVAIIILLVAIGDHQYSYYQLVRWVTTISAGYLAYEYYSSQKTGWMWIFIAVAILFNPIVPFYLEKNTWHIFDFIGAVLFFVTIFIKNK